MIEGQPQVFEPWYLKSSHMERSKKQLIVTRSSAEVEYKVVAQGMRELLL